MKNKIIFGAQACGFGPVSKMISLVKHAVHSSNIFIGDEVALEFVNHHKGFFTNVINREKCPNGTIKKYISKCDYLIIVMDHNLAYAAHLQRKPFYFVDSLFGFWYSLRSDAELVNSFKALTSNDHLITQNEYDSFSVHEKKLLSHYLASESYAQNFIGVEERVSSFNRLSRKHVQLTTPLADHKSSFSHPNQPSNNKMVFNLGGIKNFLIKDNKCEYLSLMEKLAMDCVQERSDVDKILICSGCYQETTSTNLNGKRITKAFLSKEKFISEVAKSRYYLSSFGLTAFYESLFMYKPTIFLPEQHSSQLYNMKTVKNTFLKDYSISIFDILGNVQIPEDDFDGSLQINRYISTILNSRESYSKLREAVFEKLNYLSRLNTLKLNKNISDLISKLQTGLDFNKIVNDINQKHNGN